MIIMNNLRRLTRNELSKVNGGGTCAVVAHFQDGSSGILPNTVGMTKSQARRESSFISSELDNGESNQWGASSTTYCCDSCGNHKPLAWLY